MTTIRAIGDIHGKDVWEKLINEGSFDICVFVGDYVDAFRLSDEVIIKNAEKLFKWVSEDPEKRKLIIGNHDLQYIYDNLKYRCTGYRASMTFSLYSLFKEYSALFSVAYQYQNYLFTHAGVSRGYFEWLRKELEESNKSWFLDSWKNNLADCLNNLQESHLQEMLHVIGYTSGGSYKYGGITWARPNEWAEPFLPLHQVVGHTAIDKIDTRYFVNENEEKYSYTIIDVLDKTNTYWEKEI